MLSKNEIKDIQRLRFKKSRDEVELFVAEGPKIVAELLQAVPLQFKKIYALQPWIQKHQKNLQNTPVQEITADELEKISQLQQPNEVVAVLDQFAEAKPLEDGFALYLDTIQDPGNLGTIIRIADWFGIPQIVCSEGCVDLYNPKVVQATMASIARVAVFYDVENTWLLKQNRTIYAASLYGRSLYQFPVTTSGILIIGNESKGIRASIMEQATEHINIPRIGAAESLNAAVATGIILSHLVGRK